MAHLLALAPAAWAACSDRAGLEVDWHGFGLKQMNLSHKILTGARLADADLTDAKLGGAT